jgi:transposase
LRLLTEQRIRMVQERTRLVHRLCSHLKQYFPQVLEWFPDRTHPHCWEFVQRWSSLQSLQQARPHTVPQLLRRWRWSAPRRQTTLQQIRSAVALTSDQAVLDVFPLLVQMLARELLVLQADITRLEEEIAERYQSRLDAVVFTSLPGAGPVYASQLAAIYGTDHSRFDAPALQCFSGIAPVTEQSGQQCWVHHRLVCPVFVRQTFHGFAGSSIPHSRWANAYYHQQRQRGASHHQALRSLAFKWIRIITRCWKDGTPYSEEKYLQALRRRHSPLIALLETLPQDGASSASCRQAGGSATAPVTLSSN